MHFLLSLAVVGLVVVGWVSICLRLVSWHDARAARREARLEPRRAAVRRIPRQRRRPVLPEGHRPPPGLGPLSPSERFLTQEARRGLRELQLFLVDQ